MRVAYDKDLDTITIAGNGTMFHLGAPLEDGMYSIVPMPLGFYAFLGTHEDSIGSITLNRGREQETPEAKRTYIRKK